jgi:hypothetical protein
MKLPVLISSTVGVFAIIGGLYAFDCNYTRAEDHKQLKERFENKLLRDEARDLRNRMWDIQRNVGEKEGRRTREYKELKDERDMVLRELNK